MRNRVGSPAAAIVLVLGALLATMSQIGCDSGGTTNEPTITAKPQAPQTPPTPLPYIAEDVTYPNPRANITLAGTLTYPRTGAPFPSVVLILGSGRLTRDCEVAGKKIFLVLADYLTQRGFAVLRVDKRGIGASTGDYLAVTSNELGDDVLAGIEFMKGDVRIDPKRIGVFGLSEGGLLGPAVANASPDVAFVVAAGGPALVGEQIFLTQGDLVGRARGETEELLALRRDFASKYNVFVRLGESREQLKVRLQELSKDYPASIQEQLRLGEEVATSPWYRFYIDYDPAPALAKLEAPILFFIGEKDLQVSTDSLPVAENALREGGNKDFLVKELPGINHAMHTSDTGNPDDYGKSAEVIAPVVLTLVGDWIEARTRR